MFYKYKLVFFIIMYSFCAALYYFINQQLILTGIMSGFLLGSAIVFAVIILACFAAALITALLSKLFYITACKLFKIKTRGMLFKTFWGIFTGLSYASVFVVFLKMIEY